MNGYVSAQRFAAVGSLPVSLPETELRRGSIITVATFALAAGQRASVRLLTLNILRATATQSSPDAINSPFGWAAVGLYAGSIVTSPLLYVAGSQIGVTATDPYQDCAIVTPGNYSVRVFNNTGLTGQTAVDLAVSVTGMIRFYV